MSGTDASVNTVRRDHQTVNYNGPRQENIVTVNQVVTNQQNQEILHCFVCDAKVQGRRYALATCKTQNSRARVIEKLGELVGERYVVVISEDDVICRSCANLMNTLDRLEVEMKGVRSAVLRFLERKYSLAEGELLESSALVRPSQPPQITTSNSQAGDYHSRKRGPVSTNDANCPAKKSKKSTVWMQCDKCRYTTLYNTFMVHHIRQHMKQKVNCDKCGVEYPGRQQTAHKCPGEDNANENNSEGTNHPGKNSEIGENIDGGVTLPIMSMQPNLDSSITGKDEQIELISLTNPNTLQFQTIIANETSSKDGHPMFMRVLQQLGVSDELGHTDLVPIASNEASMIVNAKDNSTKQMLTLAEDGSLEMVAVDCWDDVHPSDHDPDVPF